MTEKILEISTGPTYIDRDRGFVPSDPNATMVLGESNDIATQLRRIGWSEVAIEALLKGYMVSFEAEETPFGTAVSEIIYPKRDR